MTTPTTASVPPVLWFGTDAPEGGAPAVAVDLDRLIVSRMLIQANSGGGKSRALRALIEQTADRGVQQLVIDHEGEFGSLAEAFPFIIVGGDAGHVPLPPASGAGALCRALMESGASAVLDLSEMEIAGRQAFVAAYLSALMLLPRALWRPLIVTVDEAQVYAPERGSAYDGALSLPAMQDLATRGRKRAFCLVCACQRISGLSKDVAGELLNVCVGRTNLDVDVDRAGKALGFATARRRDLTKLTPGTFFAIGPAIDAAEVTLVQSAPVRTTHPEPGRITATIPAPPPGALSALVEQLAAAARTGQPADSGEDVPDSDDDVIDLDIARRRVAALRARLRSAVASGEASPGSGAVRTVERIKEVVRTVEVPILRPGEAERLAAVADAVAAMGKDLVSSSREIRVVLERLSSQPRPESRPLVEETAAVPSAAPVPAPSAPVPVPVSAIPSTPPKQQRDGAVRTDAATKSQPAPTSDPRRLKLAAMASAFLDTLAGFESLNVKSLDRSTLAVWSKVSPTSSSVGAHLSSLSNAGLVTYPVQGRVALTAEGRKLARPAEPPKSLDELHTAWLRKLPDGPAKLLRALLKEWREGRSPVKRDKLASLAGYSPTSSSIGAHLSTLKAFGLVDYPRQGMVAPTPRLQKWGA